MIYISTFSVILYAVLCRYRIYGAAIYKETVDQTPIAATCSSETAAKVFAAILFIDLVSVHDPEIVFGLSLPSDIAADLYYNEKLRIFQQKGFSNAEELASISSSAILLVKEFTIAGFYFVASRDIGDFLVEKGFLNCDNVIQWASTFFDYAEKEFKSLGPDIFESYLGAILLGEDNLLGDLGYTAEEKKDNWKILTDLFYKEYLKYADYVHARA